MSIRSEFKHQLKLGIIAAIGFTIAFAWRDAVFNSVQNIVERFTETTSLVLSNILTAVFITFIGVIVIYITSKILK